MKKQKRVPTGDYETGFCRAPKKHRYQKGQPSPNPAGRRGKKPKPDAAPGDILSNIMQASVHINLGGKSVRMNGWEALFLQTRNLALKGNPTAMRQLAEWSRKLGLFDQVSNPGGGVLVVPGAITPEDWAKAAFDQQAPFRGNIGEASDNKEDEDPKP